MQPDRSAAQDRLDALAFYADPANYENATPRTVRPVIADRGAIARAVLEGLDERLDLARLLLTPGARLSDEDDGLSDEWVKGRIRWHRLDGNDDLADEMLRKENSVRTALGKEPLDV